MPLARKPPVKTIAVYGPEYSYLDSIRVGKETFPEVVARVLERYRRTLNLDVSYAV